MPSITIILNPCAGRGRGARCKSQLQSALPHARILETKYEGEAEYLAGENAAAGEILIAAGGDGTLGEVLNGSLGSGAILGVLPLGTGNDFARTLGIPDIPVALQNVKNGKTRRVDVGKCENRLGSRFFLNVCGAGFDALVARRINEARSHFLLRHLKGTPAYLQAVGAQLWGLRSVPLKLKIDGESHEMRAVLCAIANAKSYGGGMKVAPDAQIDDGLLDVVVIGDTSRSEFLRAFPGVFRGEHISHPKVRVFRGQNVEIEGDLPLLCDGESWGELPASFEILPGAVEFLSPP